MFRNYFKVAIRSLMKKKIYSLINILGLATGMAVCLLIVLFIKSELGYDSFHGKADRVYRMVVKRQYPGRATSYAMIPQSYAYAVKQELPGVEEAVRVFNAVGNGTFQLSYGDHSFEERRVLFADSNFFRVFSAKWIAGEPNEVLAKAHSVVLNETTARKYFGDPGMAVGKFLKPEGNNADPLLVTGVCKDWPANSHVDFDMLLSTAGNNNFDNTNYVNFGAYTYLLLRTDADPSQVESRFAGIISKYAAGNIEKQFGVSFQQFQANGNGYTYYLQPLTRIHLISHLEAELKPNGSLRAVYIFSLVAVFILVIACINFINLSTARSVERAKEVGIRKTFGSERKGLILQFLTESTMLSCLAMILSIGLALLLLPLFNQLSGKALDLRVFLNFPTIATILSFTFFTGIVAGLYPALVLSSFQPMQVLKGRFKSGSQGLALRNGLVIFQFAISVILIICTIVVNSQMRFMTGQELGFNKDNTIIIERTDLLADQTTAFKTELKRIPGVENVSGAGALPGQPNFFGVSWQEQGSQEPMTGRGMFADDQYQATLGLEMKDGRFFSKEFPTDSLSVVLNESAVKELGLKKAVGSRLVTPEGFYNAPDGSPYVYNVIGVVKDFHYQSMHVPITPLVFTSSARFNDVMFLTAVRIKGNQFKAALASIEKTWKDFVNDRPFHYEFLDKTVAEQYKAEAITQKIFTFFSSLAILIACIGLLGLAAYATQQRTREIGIRKVLGASAWSITGMLSRDFLKLVILAALIAFPLAWWAMYKWLEDFTYRIHISWWIFAIAGFVALLIALFTISFQAIKAALASPVKALRTE